MTDEEKPLLHICYAPADREWVHGRMVCELGLRPGQYRTREDDGLGELQLKAISRAVEESRFTVLVASSASRWNQLAQFAAKLAQHAGLEQRGPRLIIIARDFQPDTEAAKLRLSLDQRALVNLDCSDDDLTKEAMARLRKELELADPIDERPPCPYPGLARFTAANRDLLFGRDDDRQRLVDRIHAGHRRILVVGPSGSGKSSLIHAAVLPELAPQGHVVQVVPRGDHLADALRHVADVLKVPCLAQALDTYQATVHDATDAQIEQARITLGALPVPDARRRVIVIDPLEEIFAEDDVEDRMRLFALLGGLWSLPWCTVILCMRADFYGALMVERCWRELEDAQYTVAPLDEPGLRAAIVEPALRAGVHVDAALVERLIREIDRDRSSVPLPLLQVALAQLWTRLRWRYLSLADYEQFVDRDQRGLAVVLGTHATAVVQRLTLPADRVVAQRVLLDLVHLGEGRPDTRRRRSLDDLRRGQDTAGQLERVVGELIEGRLVTAADGHEGDPRAASSTRGEDTAGRFIRHIDLAHDTLIAGWPMLASWIRERRDDLRTQRRLEARATTRALLTADELPESIRWLTKTETPAGQLLEASDALRTLVRRSVVARRLRRIAIVAGLLASIALALVFGVQAQRLRDEKAKTQQSIAEARKAADLIVFEADHLIRTAGTSPERKRLLDSAQDLIGKLNSMAAPSQADRRTGMAAKLATADTALAAGQLTQASAMYQEVLHEAKARAASDPSNTDWQRDLSVSFNKLGDVAVSAGKLDDARGFYEQDLAVAKVIAGKDPSNTDWQFDLSVSYERLGHIAVHAGKLDEARGFYEQALAVRKPLAGKDPSNTDWQRALSVPYEGLGDVTMRTGKLNEASGFYEQALAVRKPLADKDPSNTDWQHDLAVLYERLGEVAVRAGKLADARGFYEQALTVAKVLTGKDPFNADWQHDLSISYEGLGEVAVRAEKLNDARGFYEQAVMVRKALVGKDPSNTDRQRDLLVSLSKLGDVAVRAGKLDDAGSFYEQAFAVAKMLAREDPSNPGWQRDLSVSFNNLGDVAVRAGRLDDASRFYEQALALRKAVAGKDPSNTDWQRDLSVSYEKLGEVAVRAGQLNDARGYYEQALAVAKALAGKDPSNTDWQRDLSVSYEKLGEVAVRAGKLDDARGFYEQALAVAKALAGKDPSNTDWQRDLSISYEGLGDAAVRAGKLDDARGFYEQALAVAKALAGKDPSNTDWQRDLSVFLNKLGEVAVRAGKLDDARGYYEQALAVRKVLAGKDPSNMDWQYDLSVSYERLGDVAGDLDGARGFYEQALAIRKALANKDPSNTDWQRNLSVSFIQVGDVAVRGRKLDDARGLYEQAFVVAKALAGKDPSNAEWQLDLCKSLIRSSLVARTRTEKIQMLTEARRIHNRLAHADVFRGDPQFTQLGQLLVQLISST